MKIFKLFDLPNDRQVLLAIEGQNEEGQWEFSITSEVDGIRATVTCGYEEENKMLQQFEIYNKESAETFYKGLLADLSNLS